MATIHIDFDWGDDVMTAVGYVDPGHPPTYGWFGGPIVAPSGPTLDNVEVYSENEGRTLAFDEAPSGAYAKAEELLNTELYGEP